MQEAPAPPVLPPDPVNALVRTHAEAGIEPDAWVATPDWHGEPLDYGLGIDMLWGPAALEDPGVGQVLLGAERQMDAGFAGAGRFHSTEQEESGPPRCLAETHLDQASSVTVGRLRRNGRF